uniref:Uncharacterized protein n=1 Tax=Oryza rufipogon TaxID=4529 RepID=A0A0E0QIS7_ORYRU
MADKSIEWMDEDVQGCARRPCEGMRMGTRGSMAGMAACDKAGGEGKVRRRLEESEAAAAAAEGETGEEKGERFRGRVLWCYLGQLSTGPVCSRW